MIRRATIAAITLSVVAAVLSGCSRSPQVTFYTLGSDSKVAVLNPAKPAPSVSIANVTLPELVDRPQLVERLAGNRVEILETHRWAEPLKNGIARLLAENLGSRLESNLVTVYPQQAPGEPDYRVAVDIRRFESSGNVVSIDAFWSIRRTAAAKPASGRSQINESKNGDGYEALVSAYNQAIVAVGSEIAQAIRTDWSAGR